MPNNRIALTLTVAAVLLASGVVLAGQHETESVTLEGTIACAMCTLKLAKECQDVLVVDKGEEKIFYYMVKNDVSGKLGHICGKEKPAVVTGTIEEKDGKMWLTATKIGEPAKG